jgi:hypothetical protein
MPLPPLLLLLDHEVEEVATWRKKKEKHAAAVGTVPC